MGRCRKGTTSGSMWSGLSLRPPSPNPTFTSYNKEEAQRVIFQQKHFTDQSWNALTLRGTEENNHCRTTVLSGQEMCQIVLFNIEQHSTWLNQQFRSAYFTKAHTVWCNGCKLLTTALSDPLWTRRCSKYLSNTARDMRESLGTQGDISSSPSTTQLLRERFIETLVEWEFACKQVRVSDLFYKQLFDTFELLKQGKTAHAKFLRTTTRRTELNAEKLQSLQDIHEKALAQCRLQEARRDRLFVRMNTLRRNMEAASKKQHDDPSLSGRKNDEEEDIPLFASPLRIRLAMKHNSPSSVVNSYCAIFPSSYGLSS
uniref:Uncharacterized protein n=1 Tax=Palpitomonas bilix TaxID=652834 RepID=A0A7S3DBR5_9EUKA|mmetsp:Transcript_30757/g.80473  ORF Transcript_30757/g.80473 Transcript_30757/m.80473 type:complete len:314 (+) Transcript_30757:4845-5786(+)